MGCCKSSEVGDYQESNVDSDSDEVPTCDPCVNENFTAKGWCGICNVYLCKTCIKTHTASHRIAKGKFLPLTRPTPRSIKNNVTIKQVIPNCTLVDNETIGDDMPLKSKAVCGCVCVGEYIVTIMYEKMRLYDAEFQFKHQLDLATMSPNTICAHGYDIVVSFDRPGENNDIDGDGQILKKSPRFKDIQSFTFSPGGFSKPKIKTVGGFNTEGECFTVAMCPLYDKNPLLAAGMTVEYHPYCDDLKYQVQILNIKGKVKQVLAINPRGEPCFEGRFFLSTTQNFDDIVVSEVKERKVRGINMKTGKTVYEFGSGHPQGLCVDDRDNIYVFNDGALYWIPPLRNKIFYMHQQPGRKCKKAEATKKTVSICFNNQTRILYAANCTKATIETFRIT